MVLQSLLRSPSSIKACLSMAHEEMQTIMAPDASLLSEQSGKLWFYYADKDNWVGKEKDVIVRLLGEAAKVRVVHCQHGIPHAFCILHGDLIAEQVAVWMMETGFMTNDS